MNIIRKIGVSFGAYVEHLGKSLEDPKAVLTAAIKEINRNLRDADIKLRKVRQQECALEGQIKQVKDEIEVWKKRALKEAPDNKEKALLCLKQKMKCEKKLSAYTSMKDEIAATVDTLDTEITKVETKRDKLQSKLQIFSTRDATSHAKNYINTLTSEDSGYIDDVLDRWEFDIQSREYTFDSSSVLTTKSFEQEYQEEEEKEQLEKELESLMLEQV
jgi:phage shock protein A